MTQNNQNKPRVLVLFGGESGEHGISCATAAGVVEAIDHDRFEVVTVGITPQGQWVPVVPTSSRYLIPVSRKFLLPRGSYSYPRAMDTW